MDLSNSINNDQMPKYHLKAISRIIVLISLLVGVVYRIYLAVNRDLWYDELVIWEISHGTIGDVIKRHWNFNSAPPLFVFLIKFVEIFAGESEISLRMIPLLAGIASLAAIYFCTKKLFSAQTAFISVLILSLNYVQAEYSWDLREYSLVFILCLLLLISYQRYRDKGNLKSLILFLFIFVISLWTQYGLYIVLLNFVVVYFFLPFILKPSKKNMYPLAMIAILTIINVALIYFLVLKYQLRSGFGALYLSNYYLSTQGGLVNGIAGLIKNTTGVLVYSNGNIWGGIIIGIFLLIGIVAIFRKQDNFPQKQLLLFTGLLVASVFVLAILRLYPYGGIRQDIFFYPFILILASEGFSFLLSQKFLWKILAVIGLGLLSINFFILLSSRVEIVPNEQFSKVIQYLSAARTNEQNIFVPWSTIIPFEYYGSLKGEGVYMGAESTAIDLSQLDECIQNSQVGCWFVYSHCPYCEQFIAEPSLTYKILESYQIDNKLSGTFLVAHNDLEPTQTMLIDGKNGAGGFSKVPSNNTNCAFAATEASQLRMSYQNQAGVRDLCTYSYFFTEPLNNIVSFVISAEIPVGVYFTVDINIDGKVISPRYLNYYKGKGKSEEISIPIPAGEFKGFWISISEPPGFNDKPEQVSVDIDHIAIGLTNPH